MKKTLLTIGTASLVGALALTTPALAQNVDANLNASINSQAGANTNVSASTTVRKQKLDEVNARLQTRADAEITRRTTALNKLKAKIDDMKKVSDGMKSSISTTIQAQVNLLNNLSVKIKADQDADTLKTDVQSIAKAYRVYMLVMPQMQITAAADRLASTSDLLSSLAAKLEARISMSANADKDQLNALLADMKAKIADAKAQSAAAITAVANLKPDNGDATVKASNDAALKAARTDIRTGTKDAKDAHTDEVKMRTTLKASSETSASSTNSTE